MLRQSQARANQAQTGQPATTGSIASAQRSRGHSRMGNQAAQRLLGEGVIQAKLTVSQPGDRFEQEADRVADSVMRMVTPPGKSPDILGLGSRGGERPDSKAELATPTAVDGIQSLQNIQAGTIQRVCKECEKEMQAAVVTREDDEEIAIQTKSISPDGRSSVSLDSSALGLLTGSGQALPASLRSFFEPRMGHDFRGVRIHTDTRADYLAKAMGARAFTHGSHVVFRTGEYAPGTPAGRHLLAHELTHTVQQGASPPSAGQLATNGARLKLNTGADTASGAPTIQRVCETTPPPSDITCPQAVSSSGSGTPIQFGINASMLTAADKSTLSAIAAAWHTGGGVAILRIDGFASCDGPADLNWRLSCSRAQAVATELEAPSDGSPGVDNGHITIFANGETDQFSTTNLSLNRRAVVTAGGTPPPGPACPITITGPDEVDHYCAAYVPSDAPSCGVFPAPTITLTAAGAAPGATLTWSIVRGTARASIVGANTGASANIQGDAASGAQGDVTVQVTDGICTTAHFLTVREPSALTAAPVAANTATTVQTNVTYTVGDQFGNPMGANICIDETITLCRITHPRGIRFGDAPTNAAGQAVDRLRLGPLAGVPAGFCRKLNQSLTAGGCGPLLNNTIVFQSSGITLNVGASCVSGDPCP